MSEDKPSSRVVQLCIVVLPQSQDPMFDVTDLQSTFSDTGSTIIGRCGLLEVAFAYDAPMRKMTIHILQARDIPAKERGGPVHTQLDTKLKSTLH
ncbi:hypothetical protein M8J76_012313 [Diaphorina citri]|nr:hypothetical protein M8J76_012313 [Diaphorina citri]